MPDGHVIRRLARLLSLAVMLGIGGCDGEPSGGTGPDGPFTMTFRLDASFQGAHGGQAVEIALVRAGDGSVIAQDAGTVSSTQDPTFEFTTGSVMEDGQTYEVHYWIDSNFGGGSVGVCDPPANDHQWSSEFLSVSNDIAFTTAHEPALMEEVCATF
jgi:hypothetical protein